jgi:hypothetical protein
MAKFLIDFEWWRDPTGYRMEPVEIDPPVVFHAPPHVSEPVERDTNPIRPPGDPCGVAYHPLGAWGLWSKDGTLLYIRATGGPQKPYRPLDVFQTLYEQFAKIKTRDDVLSFVEKFGPLTKDGLNSEKGEIVDGVLMHARVMNVLFNLLSGTPMERSRFLRHLHENPFADLEVTLGMDFDLRDLRLRFRPACLLDALWLQFAQRITGDATVRQCQHCGQWFEVGPGTGRRLDARFCSDKHRISFNSAKRTKGGASYA